MKQIILFFFVLLPFCTFSQVNESFDGTEINAGWIGKDRDEFVINSDGRLELGIKPEVAGTASIGMNIEYSSDMQWEFDVLMNGTPSDNNKLYAYLYIGNDVFYYVQIGFAKDCKLGLRSKGEKDMFPRKPNDYRKDSWVDIKVTLEDNKNWTMYSREHGASYYTKEGACTYPVQAVSQGQLSFKFVYTKTLSKLFSIDNVKVQNEITLTDTVPSEEPNQPEPSPEDLPQLEGIQVLSTSSLQFIFSKAIDIEKAVFSISDIGNAIRKSYADESEAIVNTLFQKELVANSSYTISYSGITDKSGNKLPDYSEEAMFRDDEEEEDGSEDFSVGTIVINEIMADPKGLSLLPETEYVELYNTTKSTISLAGWKFSYGGSAKTIPDVQIPAEGCAVLFRSGRDVWIDNPGVSAPMDNFPASLANTGKTLQLLDPAEHVIDEVTYSKATPAKSWERSSSGEWKLSTDPRGGTPGSKNNFQETEKPNDPEKPDDPEQPSEPDEPTSPTVSTILPGEIIFNELLPDPYSGGSEYIELYNRSDKTLSLSGLSVATRKMDGTLSTHYPLSSASRILNPGGFALITKSIEGVSSFYLISSPEALCEITKLPVLANTSSTLVLFQTSDETVIDEVSYSSKWHASSIKDKKGVALERISPEGETQDPANWTSASEVVGYGTPGYQNSQYHSSADGDATGIEDPIYQEDRHNYIIPYHLDQPGYNCRIFIYAISGQRISEIANHELLGTNGQLTWDGILSNGRPLQAGVYILYAEIYHPSGKVLRYKKPFLVH